MNEKEFNRDEYISECYATPAHSVRRPHKHAELIKAWADGAQIEFHSHDDVWFLVTKPEWDIEQEYRIKPEPKPDIVRYAGVSILNIRYGDFYPNLKIIFDGETHQPKSAEVLK